MTPLTNSPVLMAASKSKMNGLRKKHEITAEQLAVNLDVAVSSLYAWECGRNRLTLPYALAWREVMHKLTREPKKELSAALVQVHPYLASRLR